MRLLEEKIREKAVSLLEGEEVALVIGYTRGSEATRTAPAFIKKAADACKLVFNPLCVNNLAKYLTEYKSLPGKVGVIIKGCDSRAVNRLISDHQVDREKIVLLGVPCPGMLEAESAGRELAPGAVLLEVADKEDVFTVVTDRGSIDLKKEDHLMEKCRRCQSKNPVVYDYLAGEKVVESNVKDGFDDVRAVEGLSAQDKNSYWDRQFARCLRCYACRNVCPACTCRECVFDQEATRWVSRSHSLSDNTAFHLVRAFHVAGRCVDCGECRRVCPVKIPLSVLNRKILHDIRDLYGVDTPGQTFEETSVLGGFHKGDPDEFM